MDPLWWLLALYAGLVVLLPFVMMRVPADQRPPPGSMILMFAALVVMGPFGLLFIIVFWPQLSRRDPRPQITHPRDIPKEGREPWEQAVVDEERTRP